MADFQDIPQDPQSEEDAIASTTGDFGHGLPSDDLHVTISRYREEDGFYVSAVQVNRTVRRLYALGLVQEAVWMLQQTADEYIEPYSLSASQPEDDIEDDGDDEEESDRAKI